MTTSVYDRLKAVFGTAWHTNGDAILHQLETEIEAGGDVTPGTVVASQPIVPDANKHIDVLGIADGGLKLGTSGSETTVLATGAEINRACDVSTRIVNLAVSTAITELAHDGKTIVMGGAGSARTFTLPASTGSGAKFRFVVGAVNTSNYLIKSVAGTDTMDGTVLNSDSDTSGALRGFTAAATDDTITLNGSTTGGAAIGDWVQLEDIAANQWTVTGSVTATGAPATPFSDTVA